MSGGGKGGGGEVTVGYRYFMGVQLAVCHGPVDNVRRIIIGEREAWSGTVGGNTTISINKPDLFGGDDREGGVVGDVDVMMGAPDQARNTYLATNQGANCPAYRGLLSLVFKRFMWSSGNPYFKAPWIEVTRIAEGWANDTVWNVDDATINTLDMNPAHIIYQCLTDPAWGMGYNTTDIGDSSFAYAATLLKNEGFGLSLPWDQGSSIEEFIGTILNHINGALGLNMATGKFELRLIRDDYDAGTLIELNESNVLEVKSFQRAAFGDAINEVVVVYTDRDGNDKPVAVQNLASIAAQGGVVSTTKKYPGIREADLAAKVAMRDLSTLASPLAQATLTTTRVLWDKEIGDVVKWVWPSLGIESVVFRITHIDKGTLTDSKITVSLVEDVFGLPNAAYTAAPPSQWVDNVVPPVAADAGMVMEAPYWEVVKHINLADRAQLETGYGFGMFMASRGAVRSPFGYVLSASADDVDYDDVGGGNFSPTGVLANSIPATQTAITLSGAYDLDSVVLSSDGGYAVIGNECVSVISCNPSNGAVTIGRGILDTVPAAHNINTRVFFKTPTAAYDTTERTTGETVYYKPRPVTGLGTLDLDDAESEVLVLNNRATRPYPPGNVKIADEYYPVTIAGPTVTMTWAHRDRAAQTVDFADYTVGNIGPEAGVTYRAKVYNGNTLLRTYDIAGDQTSWVYPTQDSVDDGNLATLRFVLSAVRDGLESWQAFDHTFARTTVSGGTFYENKPAAPTLFGLPDAFAVYLSWNFGDSRENLYQTEVWMSETPDFADGSTLHYEAYPGQDYTHEIAQVGVYRWYWIRVSDDNGQLSDWSNAVSVRPLRTDPIQSLNEINGLLTGGDSAYKIEMVADRFSIVAPDGSKTPFAVVEVTPGNWKTLLNSDVLIGGNVDIANLNTGALPNDVMMSLGGGVIELDGAGEIRVFKDLSANADFVKLTSGEIRFLRYIGGSYQTYNYLSRLEAGTANNNTAVTIPGYWKSQPRVMVSPASLSLYKATYAAQDQGITCTPGSITETSPGSGVWQFTPTATLNLAANTGGGAINNTSGSTSTNSWTSATQTTAANCNQITPVVSLQSQRGNGISQYYYRTVKWRVEYWNGSSWVAGSWRNVNMGAQFAAVSDTVVFDFPSAAAWQWRIYSEAFDTDGTVFGSISYDYSTNSVNPVSGTSLSRSSINGITENASEALTFGTPGGSGEIYQVTYSWTEEIRFYSNYVSYPDNKYQVNGSATVHTNDFIGQLPTPGSRNSDPGAGSYTSSEWHGPFNRSVTLTGSSMTFDASYISKSLSVVGVSQSGGGYSAGSAAITITSASATVYRRTPQANSTTAANSYTLGSYTYNLSAAQVLATGSLNWLAIGE